MSPSLPPMSKHLLERRSRNHCIEVAAVTAVDYCSRHIRVQWMDLQLGLAEVGFPRSLPAEWEEDLLVEVGLWAGAAAGCKGWRT